MRKYLQQFRVAPPVKVPVPVAVAVPVAVPVETPTPKDRARLEMPEHVTWAWLTTNVPVRFWLWFLGLLFVAFAVGFQLGLIPEVARIVGPLMPFHAAAQPAAGAH